MQLYGIESGRVKNGCNNHNYDRKPYCEAHDHLLPVLYQNGLFHVKREGVEGWKKVES